MSQSRYDLALEAFLEAYRITSHFAVLYNIGQSYVALGKPVEAISALERYLREGKDRIPADRSAQVRAQIAAEKAHTAELRIGTNVSGAAVSVDGQIVGSAPLTEPVRVTAGSHVVSVSVAGKPGASRSVTLAEREVLDIEVEALPEKPGYETAPPEKQPGIAVVTPARHDQGPIETRANASKGTLSSIGYVVGGIGLAFGAGALGHYFWNRGRYEDWKATHSQLTDPGATDYIARQTQNNELAQSIDDASRVTVGLATAGGALLATGVTLVVVDGLQHPALKTNIQGSAVALSLDGVW